MRSTERPVDLQFDISRHRASDDGAIVLHTDEENAPVSVRERNACLFDPVDRDAALPLGMMAFVGELSLEGVRIQREGE
jgi:hypothetical protein